jgi:hypothetical protein
MSVIVLCPSPCCLNWVTTLQKNKTSSRLTWWGCSNQARQNLQFSHIKILWYGITESCYVCECHQGLLFIRDNMIPVIWPLTHGNCHGNWLHPSGILLDNKLSSFPRSERLARPSCLRCTWGGGGGGALAWHSAIFVSADTSGCWKQKIIGTWNPSAYYCSP